MTDIFLVVEPDTPVVDVVFLHGLGGDARTTWVAGEAFWPRWLGEDVSGVAVWSVEYEASPSGWLGRAMPIQDRAVNVLARLQNEGVGKRPLVFVTHSMGGLLAKQMLLHAYGGPSYASFAAAARGVVFLGTPHYGADMATFLTRLKVLLRTTAAGKDLARNGAHLRDLNVRYRDWVHQYGVGNLVFFEAYKTRGVQIVDAGSADPGLAGAGPIAVDADHFAICKPAGRGELVYGQVRRFVAGIRDTVPTGDPDPEPPMLRSVAGTQEPLIHTIHMGRMGRTDHRCVGPDDEGRRARRRRARTATAEPAGTTTSNTAGPGSVIGIQGRDVHNSQVDIHYKPKEPMARGLRRALIALIAAVLIGAVGWAAVALVVPQYAPSYKTQFLIDTAGDVDAVRDSLTTVVRNSGDRDALALRSFGGECGVEDNTTQLVDFDTDNRADIIDAAQALRTTGKAALVRGVVEAVADFSTAFSIDATQVNRIIVVTRHGVDACDDDAVFVEKEIRDRIAAAGLAIEFRLIGHQVPAGQRDRLAGVATGMGAPAPVFTQNEEELNKTLGWFTNTEPVLRDARTVVDTLNAAVDQVNGAVKAITDGRLDLAEQNLAEARGAVTDTAFDDLQARRTTLEARDVHEKATALRARQAQVLDAADRLLKTARSGVPMGDDLATFRRAADDYNTEVHTVNHALAGLRAQGPGSRP